MYRVSISFNLSVTKFAASLKSLKKANSTRNFMINLLLLSLLMHISFFSPSSCESKSQGLRILEKIIVHLVLLGSMVNNKWWYILISVDKLPGQIVSVHGALWLPSLETHRFHITL